MSSFTDGNCSNWGNPLSEMYLESLRYYAGLDANVSTSTATDSSYIPDLDERRPGRTRWTRTIGAPIATSS